MIAAEIKNCGVCIHSNAQDGRYCLAPAVLAQAGSSGVDVGIARSAAASPCGPDAALWTPCACLQPTCPRHGKDRRRET